jgi:carbon-monoxide dehydrogenase small subunit
MKTGFDLVVNGERISVFADPSDSLLEVLRNQIGLTGTKMGCNGGDCGACTVHLNGRPVNACLLLAIEVSGQDITTIEGLQGPLGLHPTQQAFLESFAVQCGFCTPGMIMSASALFNSNSTPTEEEIREALHGNICRCTGYTKIIESLLNLSTANQALADRLH